MEPAGFAIRLAARIIDSVARVLLAGVAGFVAAILLAILSAAGVIDAGWQGRTAHPHGPSVIASSLLFGLLSSVVYDTACEALGGATFGKAICGLRTIRNDGGPCTFGKALGRSLAYFVDSLFFGLVAWSSMSKSPMAERLGDKWAGTYVIKAATLPKTAERGIAAGIVFGFLGSFLVQLTSVIVKAL